MKGHEMSKRFFLLPILIFCIPVFFITNPIPFPKLISIASFLLYGILLLYCCSRSFILGSVSNMIFLLSIPELLIHSTSFILTKPNARFILTFIVYGFVLSIISIFVLSYRIRLIGFVPKSMENNFSSSKFKKGFKKTFIWFSKYQSFFKIFFIFLQYIILLYSLLNTFALLYSNLGNIFHEGIESDAAPSIIQSWDAIYFSATTFFTIGFGDITPNKYSEITKIIVIIQAIIGHLLTIVFWPIVILFTFGKEEDS